MSVKSWALGAFVALVFAGAVLPVLSQQPAKSESNFQSEEYLLLGDATRGAGEPMIAVDPTNPKNIIAVAMGNLQQIRGENGQISGAAAYQAVPKSTITWLAVTHDGGITWKISELPILRGKFQRCPDSLAEDRKSVV